MLDWSKIRFYVKINQYYILVNGHDLYLIVDNTTVKKIGGRSFKKITGYGIQEVKRAFNMGLQFIDDGVNFLGIYSNLINLFKNNVCNNEMSVIL